jgi:choline dehydrogenase-like flavoprotein
MKTYDVLIAGSGPGGSTVAREMARAGKSVCLFEKGRDHQWIGNHLMALDICAKSGLYFTEQGLSMTVPETTGGATIMYCGAVGRPVPWLKTKYGIDIEDYCDAAAEEIGVRKLPDELLGDSSKRVMAAANELGYKWEPLEKFMRPEKCPSGFACGAKCMLGCACGAKWTAREYIADAVKAGADLMLQHEVIDLIVEDNTAVGLRVRHKNQLKEFRGKVVVVAGGGLGAPRILKRSGVWEAGDGCFMDATMMVYGVAPKGRKGNYCDPPMTVGSWEYHEEEGVMLSHLIDPWMLFPMMMTLRGVKPLLMTLKYNRVVGMMIKIKDELSGWVNVEGDVDKPFTRNDRRKLDLGSVISRRILIKSGCDPNNLYNSPVRGTHPSGTCRIGNVVDKDLKLQRYDNCYVCDASVVPEALDRPVVLMMIGFGRRLADHLKGKYWGQEKTA